MNDLGGKRVNGKRPGCKHFPSDIVVVDRVDRPDGTGGSYSVGVLACSACGKNLGPEDKFEVGEMA